MQSKSNLMMTIVPQRPRPILSPPHPICNDQPAHLIFHKTVILFSKSFTQPSSQLVSHLCEHLGRKSSRRGGTIKIFITDLNEAHKTPAFVRTFLPRERELSNYNTCPMNSSDYQVDAEQTWPGKGKSKEEAEE